jgi:hypothetical protein
MSYDPGHEKGRRPGKDADMPRLAELRQMLDDYVRDLRAIIEKLRRKLN